METALKLIQWFPLQETTWKPLMSGFHHVSNDWNPLQSFCKESLWKILIFSKSLDNLNNLSYLK